MRPLDAIRKTAFIVARQNRSEGLDDVRPMPASSQLHFDVLDLLDALAEAAGVIATLEEVVGSKDLVINLNRNSLEMADRREAEKDEEIGALTTVLSAGQMLVGQQNVEIDELRATVAHFREWCG